MQYVSNTACTGSAFTEVFVQGATPEDLQAKIAAAIAAYDPGGEQTVLASFDLAGGGDGHTFVARLALATSTISASEFPGAVAVPVVLCYMAADAVELPKHRPTAAVDAARIYDEPVAGASKGTRFMAAIVTGVAPS